MKGQGGIAGHQTEEHLNEALGTTAVGKRDGGGKGEVSDSRFYDRGKRER